MSPGLVLQRLRRFLLALAAFTCIGTIIELWLTEHWADPPQILPFILCGLGFIVIVAMLLRPQATTVRLLRWSMGITFLGSLFGVFEHIEHNIEFALEIRPNAAAGDLFFEAIGGANPLMAPGILALAALIAVAATYCHPALLTATPTTASAKPADQR